MRRIVGALLGLCLMVGLLLLPALFFDGGDREEVLGSEPTTITSYVADFAVHEDGGMDVVETLTVQFPGGLHGIFRFFDRLDPSEPDVRHRVSDVSVTLDGGPVEVDASQQDLRYDVLKIGDPDTFVPPGQHVYEIRYHVTNALTPGDDVDAPTQFYWNLVPQGWEQEIASADLTVHLPEAAEQVRCTVGVGEGEPDRCDVTGEGTTDLRVTTRGLGDHTPVTVLVGQDLPTPDQTTLPWPARFDRVLGSHVWMPGASLALALLVAGIVTWWLLQTREAEPAFPLQYAPPEGIGPAQAHYVLTESTDREQFVASLLHASERGAMRISHHKEGRWLIHNVEGQGGLAGLDRVTRSVSALLTGKPGTYFVAEKGDVVAGLKLKGAMDNHTKALERWVNDAKLFERSGPGLKGTIAVLTAVAVVVIWTIVVLSGGADVSIFALPAATLGGLGLPLVRASAAARRTPQGRELWSQVGGFRRMLATPSAEARFDFAGRENLYAAYLPWAVAFGCADRWAEKFQVETGQPPPVPSYVGVSQDDLRRHPIGLPVATMVDDFDSTLGRSISSYEASVRASSSSSGSSSSSSSGGFSGGGGGGGGGGGSW